MSRILFALFPYAALFFAAHAKAHHQWTWQLPPRHGAWEEVQRIGPDRDYPVFMQGGLVLVSCEHNGALLAIDAQSGKERWRFYTGGPIREEAAGDGERIFAASFDGNLYCLDHDGKLLWKKQGGPSHQKVIGHQRIVSSWISEAAPLVHNGVVYYLAGYWPVDGIYLHALDAKTGETLWTNSALQVRGYFLWMTESGQIAIRGHAGGAMVDARTGQLSQEKLPKPPPIEHPEIEGVSGTIAAWSGGRYVAVTQDGAVMGFGPEETAVKTYAVEIDAPKQTAVADAYRAAAGGTDGGFAIVAGLGDGELIEGLLAADAGLRLVAFDDDAEKLVALRASLDQRGLLDQRVALMTTEEADLPPYVGSHVIANTQPLPPSAPTWVRPHGGRLAKRRGAGWSIETRGGALEGADDWEQEFANAANTLSNSESLVKAPLGVLWYGGPAGDSRYYYDGDVDHQSGHGLNPQPVPAEVVAGRVIMQAPGLLAAFDQYTGRLLWESPLPEVYTFGGAGGGLGKHSKNHPEPWKHEAALKFDVKPTQRARASGFNFASLPDAIYVCAAEKLLRFDPGTGAQLSAWPVPLEEADLCWGGLRIEGGILVATAFRPQDLADAEAGHDGNGGEWAGDRMPMAHLVALDRHSGELLWHRPATWGYVNRSGFCIGSGKVFCCDLVTGTNLEKWKEAGRELPAVPPRLLALDLKTGREVWRHDLKLFVRNIAFSAAHDLLLVPCRNLEEWRDNTWVRARKSLLKEPNKNDPGLMRAFRGEDGKLAWQVEGRPYHHPHIILNELVIDRYGAVFDLLTGERATRPSPLTGQPELWSFRKGGCNHLIACETLVTWRTAIYDLATGSGVMDLTGLDAGCSPTLIPAGGLLNIPNFGTHHKRNRMTAMALVHRPANELRSQYFTSTEKSPEGPPPAVVTRAGYNFAGFGDRMIDGTLWQRIDRHSSAGLSFEPKSEVRWLSGGTARTGSAIASSAVVGIESLHVPLLIHPGGKGEKHDRETRRYTIRLHFAELEARQPGERVFDIAIEGETVVKGLDIAKEAEGADRPFVEELSNVEVAGELDLEFIPRTGAAILGGIELVLEPKRSAD